jgi:ketosteroid isomerase-like protein
MAEDMDQAVKRMREGYEAFNRGDFDAAARWIHPEIVWHRAADFERAMEGRDAVRQSMDPSVFQRQQSEVLGMEAIGDSVLVDTVFHATGAGSGIELDQEGYHLWTMRDGMAARFEFFLDRDEALRAARKPEGLDPE